MRRSFWFYLLGIITMGILTVVGRSSLVEYAALSLLTSQTNESEEFRNQWLSEEVCQDLDSFTLKNDLSRGELLSILMLDQRFDLTGTQLKNYKLKSYQDSKSNRWGRKKEALETLTKGYQAIWNDLVYFPVPASTENEDAVVAFDNSWMFERTFGGKRGHEGTDIMAGINQRGYYPVISMTDGVVENIGWLTKGGYRIGIRSSHGGYFYYAHLAEYSREFKKGESVKAGELLGFMGDTGYSEIEGTTGNFDVHLHVGIYIKTEHYAELSVNPYWILKYLEQHKLSYAY